MLVDVHAHLDHPTIFPHLDKVIERAKSVGITAVITNGLDKVSNRATLEIADRFDIVKPALGIYPPDALKAEVQEAINLGFFKEGEQIGSDFDIEEELDFIRKQDVFAIGEIGLDYKNGHDKTLQNETFSSQVEIAMKKHVPIIVHSRKAEGDVLDILEQYGYKKTVLHCFSGKKGLIRRAVDLGFSFSIPTNIVKSSHFQSLVEKVPLSRLLTETDSPFMSPFPEKMNEPAYIVESIRMISKLKNLELQEATSAVFMNYKNMF